MSPALAARTISKSFPGVKALQEVSFELLEGEIHALCGENGAGKSTLIKLLSGIHPHGSYEGAFEVFGQEAKFQTISDGTRAGVAVIYQELALVEEMSVAENIFLGSEPLRWSGLINWPKLFSDAKILLDRFGVDLDPTMEVRRLGVGQKQLIEIVKALAKNSRILILDEPTAALAEHEVQILLEILRDLRSRGISCIYISHRLDEVFAIADHVTVLRDGCSVFSSAASDTSKAEVIKHMVGREIRDLFPRRSCAPGDVVLKVEGLNVSSRLHDISFELRAGEVLGIGGLMGAGRSELLMHLFGAYGKRAGGRVRLRGQDLAATRPDRMIDHGLVLVTEDRRRYGLVLEKDIGFNLSLSALKDFANAGWLDQNRERATSRQYFQTLEIKAPGLQAQVDKLSGGNQQKVVLGKALMTQPKIVMLDEPTRGIDVGAKIEIYELINKLTDQGKAVLLVSSELPELLGMSDRILMLHEGRVGGVFSRAEATQEKLMRAAMAA